MLLMPQKDWQWKYNDSYGVLGVSLGSEIEFLTSYKAKLLIPDALSSMEFNIAHAKFYMSLLDRLPKTLSLSDAAIVQIALNATAAHFMLTPQMPKSWFLIPVMSVFIAMWVKSLSLNAKSKECSPSWLKIPYSPR